MIKLIKNTKKFKFNFLILFLIMILSQGVLGADSASVVKVNLLNQNPDPVMAGEIVEVRFSVENQGYSSTNNLKLEIENEFPFEVVGDNIKDVGNLLSGQSDENKQIVSFKLKVNKESPIGEQKLNVNVYEGDNTKISKSYDFNINVRSEDRLEIEKIDVYDILPGEKKKITFTLTNKGNSNLDNLNFLWEGSDGAILPVEGDNSVLIDNLNSGESVDVSFSIMASSAAEPNLYELNLKVLYENTLNSQTSSFDTSFGIYVGGGTDFDMVFDEISDNEYVFTIANIGANDVTSVKISIDNLDKIVTDGKNSEIIGNLNQGDYTSTSFVFNSIKTEEIDFKIEYTNTLGKREEVIKTVKIASKVDSNFSQTRPAFSSGDFENRENQKNPMSNLSQVGTGFKSLAVKGFVVIIVIGGLFLGYKKLRKVKKNK